MEFDVKGEAKELSRLADQALNQPTEEGRGLANMLLAKEAQSLTQDQLRQVGSEINLERSVYKKTTDQYISHQSGSANADRRRTWDLESAEGDALSHMPTISFVEDRSGIKGMTFEEDEKKNIFVHTIQNQAPKGPSK